MDKEAKTRGSVERLIRREVRISLNDARERSGLDQGLLKLVVGVSGGEDSHVLLHLLHGFQEELQLELCIGHVNHRLRKESELEEEYVESLAEQYRLPLVLERAPERDPDQNLELWARNFRYGFLHRLLEQRGAHFVLTAHHQDDQAETLLFRLFSGRLATVSHAVAALHLEKRLLRPLLGITKRQIEQYAAIHRLSFVCDQSNYDRSRTRNRIRHELIPHLREAYNPNLVSSLGQIADRLGADEQYLWEETQSRLKLSDNPQQVDFLLSFPSCLRWRAVALLARKQMGEDAAKLGYGVLEDIVSLLESSTAHVRCLDLGHGLSCAVERFGGVKFSRSRSETAQGRDVQSDSEQLLPETSPQSSVLEIPGAAVRQYDDGSSARIEARLLEGGESCELIVQAAKEEIGDPYGTARAYFDVEAISGRDLTIRERWPGDLVDVWRRGRRKLKKLFQEQGIVLTLRDRIPIVELGTTILWVPGVARSKVAPVERKSQAILELSYYRGVPGVADNWS